MHARTQYMYCQIYIQIATNRKPPDKILVNNSFITIILLIKTLLPPSSLSWNAQHYSWFQSLFQKTHSSHTYLQKDHPMKVAKSVFYIIAIIL